MLLLFIAVPNTKDMGKQETVVKVNVTLINPLQTERVILEIFLSSGTLFLSERKRKRKRREEEKRTQTPTHNRKQRREGYNDEKHRVSSHSFSFVFMCLHTNSSLPSSLFCFMGYSKYHYLL